MFRFVVSAFIAIAGSLAVIETHAETSPDTGALLEAFKQLTKTPGVALTVMQNGSVIRDQALGVADLEQGVVMTGDTVVRIGSISKTMTAVTAVRLSTQGHLDLDRPVGDYLEEFSGPAHVTTPRQLASHLSGVRAYTDEEYISHRQYASTHEALSRFENDPLVAAPGEAFLYSSAGYTLLSATLAAAENSSFEAVMTEQLWAPLALTSTGLDDVRRIIPRRTRYYVKNENGVLENGPQVDNSFKWAGGGMRSSTHDLAKYGTALMGDEFLTEQEKAVLFTRATESDGQLTAYGLGWYVDIQKFLRDRQQRIPAELYDRLMAQVAGRTLIWHSGTAVGSVAVLMLEPSKGLVLALAVNMGEIEKETIVVALDLLTALAAPG